MSKKIKNTHNYGKASQLSQTEGQKGAHEQEDQEQEGKHWVLYSSFLVHGYWTVRMCVITFQHMKIISGFSIKSGF